MLKAHTVRFFNGERALLHVLLIGFVIVWELARELESTCITACFVDQVGHCLRAFLAFAVDNFSPRTFTDLSVEFILRLRSTSLYGGNLVVVMNISTSASIWMFCWLTEAAAVWTSQPLYVWMIVSKPALPSAWCVRARPQPSSALYQILPPCLPHCTLNALQYHREELRGMASFAWYRARPSFMENVYILASPCELIKNYIFHDAATLRMLTLHGISVKSTVCWMLLWGWCRLLDAILIQYVALKYSCGTIIPALLNNTGQGCQCTREFCQARQRSGPHNRRPCRIRLKEVSCFFWKLMSIFKQASATCICSKCTSATFRPRKQPATPTEQVTAQASPIRRTHCTTLGWFYIILQALLAARQNPGTCARCNPTNSTQVESRIFTKEISVVAFSLSADK